MRKLIPKLAIGNATMVRPVLATTATLEAGAFLLLTGLATRAGE